MKIKTSELSGVALDWAVAQATRAWETAHEQFPTMTLDPTFCSVEIRECALSNWGEFGTRCALIPRNPMRQAVQIYSPSTDWSQGGPLIEREQIDLEWDGVDGQAYWWKASHQDIAQFQIGYTPLIAACRAIVAAKLGDEVDVPEGLV